MSIEELQAATESRYEIEGFLAKGGMGTVYTARHRSLGSRVAIKVLPADVASSAVRLARFKREAALSANLSHPNIVPVFEFDATEGLAYLVMPFVEGETLADTLAAKGRVDYPTVRRMLGQVASALGFAHKHEVVHRDVKPANILKEEAAGRWLITDFGIAHVAGPTDTEITQTGTIIGTPAYMAPEQRWGGKVDGRSDMYSLAAVVYQCICGTHTDYLADELSKGRAEVEKALRQAEPKVTPAVARALSWALEIAKEQRPETAEAWLAALEEAEGTTSLFKWAGAAAVAALILVGVIVIRGGPETTPASATPTIAVFAFEGTVEDDAGDLPTDLAQAFEIQLQWLPDYLVIGPTVVGQAIRRQYGSEVPDVGQRVQLARDSLGATVALLGRVGGSRNDLQITVFLYDADGDPITEIDSTGSAASLNSLVSGLSLDVAESLAGDVTGWGTLPSDWEAVQAYLEANRDLVEGRYQAAVNRFDQVISIDSTFAPAHFKRMLATIWATRPSQYSTQIGAALEAATAFRDGLPPLSQQLLEAYETLLLRGDIRRADSLAKDLAERNPQAETLFLLAYVEFNFGALLRKDPGEAAYYFRQSLEHESRFAMSLWHLAAIAMLQDEMDNARNYLGRLLAVDSTSIWAEQALMADSVLFRGGIMNVVESVNNLSVGALELVSVTLGMIDAPAAGDVISRAALSTLWRRAATATDRRIAFRMMMAERVARGRFAGADSLLREGRRAQVPQDEIDRWILLSEITPLPSLGDSAEQIAAVRGLESTGDNDAEATWLVARWHLMHNAPDADRAIGELRRIANDPNLTSPLARSLAQDIDAVRYLAAGDAVAADSVWDVATDYYSVDDVVFGLTASLWPLRLRRAEVQLQQGNHGSVLEISRSFEQMAGFVDQVAWPRMLDLKIDAGVATGDPASTQDAFEAIDKLIDLLDDANGAGVALRDDATRKKQQHDR
jgi:tetratricopeptide (TPR) repeat protein